MGQCNYVEVYAVRAMKTWNNRDMKQDRYFAFALHYLRHSAQEEKSYRSVS